MTIINPISRLNTVLVIVSWNAAPSFCVLAMFCIPRCHLWTKVSPHGKTALPIEDPTSCLGWMGITALNLCVCGSPAHPPSFPPLPDMLGCINKSIISKQRWNNWPSLFITCQDIPGILCLVFPTCSTCYFLSENYCGTAPQTHGPWTFHAEEEIQSPEHAEGT